MHRLSADRTGRPHIDREMSYRNSGIPKPSQVDAGSGATPTIPPGSLVAITDNADPMDAVVYRTATRLRHHQHRVVCQVPVFAKSASASENSLISSGRSLSVENNYGYQDPFGPTQVRSHSQASRGWTSTSTSTAAGWCGQTTPRAPPAWVPKLSTTTSPGPRARGFRIWREAVTASAPRRQSGVAAPGHQQPRQRSRREYPCEHERRARRPRRQETRSSPNSGIAVSSTLQPCAGSARGPALPRLRESPRCLLAAQSAATCKHTWLSVA